MLYLERPGVGGSASFKEDRRGEPAMTDTSNGPEPTTGHDCRLDRLCPLHAAAPSMKGQLQTGIDVINMVVLMLKSGDWTDAEASDCLYGIKAGNEMALAKAEGKPDEAV